MPDPKGKGVVEVGAVEPNVGGAVVVGAEKLNALPAVVVGAGAKPNADDFGA